MTDYFQDFKLFCSLTKISWQIVENILALAEGCLRASAPLWRCFFHTIILMHQSLSTQIHDFNNLDYLATSALFLETVINSAFTKCGKDMAKCKRCTIREWLFMSRTTKFFIVRLECLAYYGKCYSSCRGLFGNLCPFVEVLISGTNPYFIGLYWPIKVCPLRSMIWIFGLLGNFFTI